MSLKKQLLRFPQLILDAEEKMKQSIFEVISNEALTSNVFRMELLGDISDITAPGQFINIKLDGMFLRRPISVCDVDERNCYNYL